MDSISVIAQAAGSAWASGLNLYATVCVLGLAGRFDLVELGGRLGMLESWWVIGASVAMYLAEFAADKIPWVDSTWDAIHTFVRIPAGALLAAGTFSDDGAAAQIGALIGGTALAGESHLVKAGTRASINLSPEPASNWIASVLEDVTAAGGIFLALQHPAWFLSLLAAFVVGGAIALYFLWNGVRSVFARIGRGLRRADTHAASPR